MTYSNQGCGKQSVVKWQHSIIYTGSREPDPLPTESPTEGEWGMLSSIRVKTKSKGDKLNQFSRVNYGKIYTVEHNVKVYDFGDVHKDYIARLRSQWRYVMDRNLEGTLEDVGEGVVGDVDEDASEDVLIDT